MKLKSFIAIAALSLFAFAACVPGEENLGEAQISVTPAEITFDATGEKSEIVALHATRDWHIDATPEWLVVNPTNGTGSTKDQAITISVEPNKGNDREDEIVFTIGLAKAYLKVVQTGEKGKLEKGSGTLEDPYSVAGVIEYVQSLGSDVQSSSMVFVKGKVSTISQDYTYNVSNGNTFGNARFNISDDGTATNGEFICYNCFYMAAKQKFVAGQTDIKAGDDVIVVGKVVNYKGNTPEFVSGENYLYSLNGVTGTAPTPETPLKPSGTGTKEDPYNVDGIITYVKALAADTQTTEQFYVKGKVSTISQNFTYNVTNGNTWGNARFNISDDGSATNEFICYNCFYFNGEKFVEGQTDIKAGDEVIVVGNVVNYKGNTPEFVSGKNHIYSLNGVVESGGSNTETGTPKGDGTLNSPYNPAGAAAAVANLTWTSTTEYQKTDTVFVKGKVKSIVVSNNVEQSYANTGDYGNASFYLTDAEDETGEFYVFRALYFGKKPFVVGQTDIKVGDVVVIRGLLMNYKGNTPETVANEAYLYSLNGATSSETRPVFGVEKTEISVPAAATGATIKVTGNVKWIATSTATIEGGSVSGEGAGSVSVAFDANSDTEKEKTYTVTVKTDADVTTKEIVVTITQGKASAGSGSEYVLDGDAIKAAHTGAWSYTSGEKKVTATDGSVWTLFNTYASTNQVTVQMNKGKGAYVVTPALPSGMEIKKIAIVLNTKNDGSGSIGDRPMDVVSEAGEVVLNDVSGQSLADGMSVKAGLGQVKIMCDETNGGAVYITSITVTYGAK